MNWYYVDAGQQAGPIDEVQLTELVRSKTIQLDTLVWHEGMENWQPYREVQADLPEMPVPPIAAALPPSPSANEAVCSQCGRIFNTEDMISHGGTMVCAGCKPLFMQKLAEGVHLGVSTTFHYAGFWIRFGAKFIDGLILGAVFLVPIFYFAYQGARAPNTVRFQVLQAVFQMIYLAAYIGYTIFFLGKYGATPGKMACKIHVVRAQGGKIGFGRATGRAFADMLSAMTCYIGYIIAGFDKEKRALHDHICDTRVVYKQF